MSARTLGEAVLRGVMLCAIGCAAFLGWGYYRSGEWQLTDSLLFTIAPTLLIVGFLNRMFEEHRKPE